MALSRAKRGSPTIFQSFKVGEKPANACWLCKMADSCLFARFAVKNSLRNSDPYLLWKKSRREQISPALGVLAYFGAGAGFGAAAGAGFAAAEAAGSGAGPSEATCTLSST
jgi:hypothetical protein